MNLSLYTKIRSLPTLPSKVIYAYADCIAIDSRVSLVAINHLLDSIFGFYIWK